MSWEMERQKLALLHQKGWIASQFKVKNNLSTILKSKYRHATEGNRHQYSMGATPIHHKSSEGSKIGKPFTAPHQIRQNAQMFDEPMEGIDRANEARHSNFKTTLNNSRQLLFLKPYTKNRSSWMTVAQKKTQIYKEINNADQLNLSCSLKLSGPIQYHTEYGLTKYSEPAEKPQKCLHKRKSLNVLKSKLKTRLELTFYQSKIKNVKQSH